MRGALQSLDLEIPLESLVAVTCASGRAAERLTLDFIASQGQRKMAPLLAPTWLPAPGRVATCEAGEVDGLRPTFVFRHADAVWPLGTRVGDITDVLVALAALLGCEDLDRCERCAGQGVRASVSVASLIVDGLLSLAGGAIGPWSKRNAKFYQGVLEGVAANNGLSLDRPWDSLSPAMQTAVLYGCPDTNFKGVVFDIERRLAKSGEGRGDDSVSALTRYLDWLDCDLCEGTGLGARTRAHRVGGVSLATLYATALGELPGALERLELPEVARGRAQRLVPSIVERVALAAGLGLGHLSLGTRASDLPPGEASRLRLAQVFSSGLQRALFVMESPFEHSGPDEFAGVMGLLRKRVGAGDSIIIVEREPRVLQAADWVIVLADGTEPGSVVLVSCGP